MLPLMSKKRVFNVEKSLFIHFTTIHDHMLTFKELQDKECTLFEDQESGSAVMTFGKFSVMVWIGKNNVSLMVSKEETMSILSLI